MRRIYLLIVCALILSAAKTNAQCSMAGRYTSDVFPTYDVSSVQYGTYITATGSDSMDIYQPHGDTFSKRPFIILAHEGTFVDGTRTTDLTVDSLCTRFVRRGYVTISIDYRLAPGGITQMLTAGTGTGTAADEVAKAISDGKAAVRYLSQHASTYRLDTNNMFIGGNSAGAVLYMHVGYLDSVGECTPLMVAALNDNGGFDGNSGNPGYTTKAKAVISLAGGLAVTTIASPGDIPSVNAQGTNDNVVPYTCNKPIGGFCPDTLCGLGSLAPQYTAVGIIHWDILFPGDGHVPWDDTASLFNSVDSLTKSFLYYMVCDYVAYVNVVNVNTEVKLFPNPATEVLNLSSPQSVSSVTMYDETGRTVVQANDINKSNYVINTSRFGKGVYFIRVRFSDENNSPVVKQVVIQ